MDTLALLLEFVLKVVHHRQTARLQAWSNWIREDLTSHPYQCHFRKAWMPYFRREGHPVVTPQAFLDFVGDHLPQEDPFGSSHTCW